MADAEYLLEASPDQAWHLAGFGPECLRKACIEERMLDHALGHDLGPRSEDLLDWGIALDPHAWRYGLVDWSSQEPLLATWRPEHRYEKTGTRSGKVADELVTAARGLVDRVHADLWADGRITGRDR